MPTLDWPTDRAFAPLQRDGFTLGVQSPKSAFTGFYTGNRQKLGHMADRLLATLVLPGCDAAAGAQREALVMHLVTSGDLVRLGHFTRPHPLGTLRYSPTLAANAAVGARTVTLSNALGLNLLQGGSFEFDSNSDGLTDGWAAVSIGSVSGVAYTRESGAANDGVYEQGIAVTYGAIGGSHEVGVERNTPLPGGPGEYTFLANVRGDVNTSARIAVEWRNGGGSVISGATVASVAVTGSPQRFGGTATAPSGTASCTVRLLASATVSTGARELRWDSCAVKAGATDLTWPGAATVLAGDCLQAGVNFMHAGPGTHTADDAGTLVLPLSVPLRRAATAGQAVLWNAPTSTFELMADVATFAHGSGRWQRPLTLQFLEAF